MVTIADLESKGHKIIRTQNIGSNEILVTTQPPGSRIGEEKQFYIKSGVVERTGGFISEAESRMALDETTKLASKQSPLSSIQRGYVKSQIERSSPTYTTTATQVITPQAGQKDIVPEEVVTVRRKNPALGVEGQGIMTRMFMNVRQSYDTAQKKVTPYSKKYISSEPGQGYKDFETKIKPLEPYIPKIIKKQFKLMSGGVTAFKGLSPYYRASKKTRSKIDKYVPLVGKINVKAEEYIYDIEKGYRRGLREQPIKTAGLTALSFGAPAVLGYFGTTATATSLKVASFLKFTPSTVSMLGGMTSMLGKGLTIGVGSYYAKSRVDIIAQEPTSKKQREKFGEILSTEATPLIVGGKAGATFWPKVRGLYETRGKKFISPEKITAPEVLSGKKNFPFAPASAKAQMKLFTKQPYTTKELKGYYPTATAQKWDTLITGAGKSELPGTYVSGKGVSSYFLRVGSQKPSSLYGGSLFEPYGKPEVMFIKPTDLKIASVSRVPGATSKAGSWKFTTPTKKGVAYIPGMKTEPEALFIPDTLLKKVPGEYYSTWGGVRVPIGKYEALGEGVKATTTDIFMKDLSRNYYSYMTSRTPTVTPGSLGSLMASSYKPTKGKSYYTSPSAKSYKPKPSYAQITPPASSYYPTKTEKTSYFPPSKKPYRSLASASYPSPPSYPSYSPPSTPSYSPPSSPPSRPSYSPPSRPSYVPPSRPPSSSYSYSLSKLEEPFIPLKEFKFGIPLKKRKSLPGSKRVFQYKPSLVGIAFRRSISKAPTGKLSGLEIRPVVISRSFNKRKKTTKRKKKKKKYKK